jgi:oligosaccharide reducing-end xylanase
LLEVLKNGEGRAFDPATHLVREQPMLAATDYTRSALEMPAAYDLWFQATGDAFWRDAATAARQHLVRSAHGKTGLWPIRSNTSNGAPANSAGFVSPGYTAQGYRTQLNLALDAAWGTATSDQATVADRLLTFFDGASNNHDLTTYGANFTVDGALTLDDGITPDPNPPTPSQALISVNGALVIAASATTDANRQMRHDFVNAVWQQGIPRGNNRYYEGLLYMTSMLIMGGQMQVR